MAAWFLARKGYDVTIIDGGGLDATSISAGIVSPLMPPPFLDAALKSKRLYLSEFSESVKEAPIYWVRNANDKCSRVVLESLERRGEKVLTFTEEPGLFETVSGFQIKIYREEVLNVVDSVLVDTGSIKNMVFREVGDVIAGIARVKCGSVVVGSKVLRPDVIIVASGPWLPEVLGFEIEALEVYSCETAFLDPRKPLKHSAIIDDSLDFYAAFWGQDAQVGDGLFRKVGKPLDAYSPDPQSISLFIDALARRVPESSYWRLKKVLSAPCAACKDTAPLVGPLKGCRNVILFAGFDGIGVTLAPALAESLARYLEGESAIDAAFSSQRSVKDLGVKPPEPFRLCGEPR